MTATAAAVIMASLLAAPAPAQAAPEAGPTVLRLQALAEEPGDAAGHLMDGRPPAAARALASAAAPPAGNGARLSRALRGARLDRPAPGEPAKSDGDAARGARTRAFWQTVIHCSGLLMVGAGLAVGGLMTGGIVAVLVGVLGGLVGLCGALGLHEALQQGPDHFQG